MASIPASLDFIIVGGGLTGCTIASLLRKRHLDPALQILLIESGSDASANPQTHTALGGMGLLGSELDYAYQSTRQTHTNDRVHTLNAGKALGGGSTINFGGWIRGDAADYDAWAAAVSDSRWNYEKLLPFMRRCEHYTEVTAGADATANCPIHGKGGPMHITSIAGSDPGRKYPLREAVRQAWTETGRLSAANEGSGHTAGLREFCENTRDGQRQPSYKAYPLDGVHVLTNAAAACVEFDDGKRATRVRLVDGRVFTASREIVLCAGTYRTPQLLMLSGIGPRDVLKAHGIPALLVAEGVGRNLHDHFALYLAHRLRQPERGLSLGSPVLTDPAFFKGLPYDWIVNFASLTPTEEAVEGIPGAETWASSRVRAESFMVYAPAGVPGIPMDGTHVATSTMILLPTSRGRVTLASTSPTDTPVIDPNYYATAHDRGVLIHAVRETLHAVLGSAALRDYIEAEAPPLVDGGGGPFEPLTTNSKDSEIDARLRATGMQHHHSGGTVAMGDVVDSECRVKGVTGLRVADASVLPVPIGGHPQATLYAMAELVAEMIAEGV